MYQLSFFISTHNYLVSYLFSKTYHEDLFRIFEHATLCLMAITIQDKYVPFLAERIVTYLLFDTMIMFAKRTFTKDFILHHFFSIILFYHHEYFNITPLMRVLALFEFSSIFLSIKSILKTRPSSSYLRKLNDICFVTSFMYIRFYLGYYQTIFPHFPNTPYITQVFGVGFFVLNAYWVTLMLRNVLRKSLPLKFLK